MRNGGQKKKRGGERKRVRYKMLLNQIEQS
jgi:hypothetical protein